MNTRLFTIMVGISLAACAATAEPKMSNVILMKGHIKSLADVRQNQDMGHAYSVLSGLDTLASLEVKDVLIGHLLEKNVQFTLRMSAWPAADRLKDIYVLSKLTEQGTREVIGWSYSVQGICIDDATANILNIKEDLDKLYASGRLTCPQLRIPTGR